MKNLFIGLFLVLLSFACRAQNGLEGIVVEKYYVSDANDAAYATSQGYSLPIGSVTWRIYVDMLPGYKFQAAYGNPTHTLLMNTTTSFFNDPNFGAVTPAFSLTNDKKGTVMLDSWLSVGGTCSGYVGVLKSEDNGTVLTSNGNTDHLLKNADPLAGLPLTSQDGMIIGTVPTFVTVGTLVTDVLNDGSANGNTLTTNNGAWSCLAGAQGPTSSNRVLIAQITTDGVFHFDLNIQIGTPSGGAEKYVSSNPQSGEIYNPALGLSRTLNPVPQHPIVSLLTPHNKDHAITGDNVHFSASASDADGTVTQVAYLADGNPIPGGVITTGNPWAFDYAGLANGTHVITAIATDNDNLTTTSVADTLVVGPHQAPLVVAIAPVGAIEKDSVVLSANVTPYDGATINSVQFFVDGVSKGVDLTSPYSVKYFAVKGGHTLYAVAIDNRSANNIGTSATVNFNVAANQPPIVNSITTSAVNGQIIINQIATITTNATDADGNVVKVKFFANGVNIGSITTGPFAPCSINYTPTVEAPIVFSARAFDNKGDSSQLVSTPSIVVFDPNALPYEISQVVQTCLPTDACMPVVSKKANMSNVIGYDVVLNYNSTKVMPTGAITVFDDLIGSASLTSYVTNIDTANSLMNISIYLNGNAIATTNFHGAGRLFCAEFTKTANFHSYDTVNFSISKLEESYTTSVVAKSVKPGNLITYKDSSFFGNLQFWYGNIPIKYDIAHPNNYLITNIYGCSKNTNAVQPDLSGNFLYDIWNGSSLKIVRDIAPTTIMHSVLDADDALRTAKVAAKDTKFFTPNIYQMIAMDVNADGLISAGDASQISQRATNVIPEFKQVWNASNGKPSHDWLFVNSSTLAGPAYQISTTYPNSDGIGYSKYKVPVVDTCQSVPVANYTDCPLISSDVYKGILLGDVNATYYSIPNDGLLKSDKEITNEIILDLSKAIKLKNGDINVPVSLSASDQITSFDFDLYVNAEKAIVKTVMNPNNLAGSINYVDSVKRLAVSLYSMDQVPAKNAISITLTKKNNAVLASTDFTAPSLITKINGQPANLKVVADATGIDAINNRTVKIYPNPASDKLNIEVSENSLVQLCDLTGKQVILEAKVNANSTQILNVQNLTTGVYVVKVYNKNYVNIQKVVITK